MTRTVDYIDAINKAKVDAKAQNLEYIDLKAGVLHKALNSGKNPTLVSCCNAMRRCMLVKDELLINPKTKSGFSSELEIRYYVNDLDLRECLFPLKTRGRKIGMPNKTDKTQDLKLKTQFEEWLSRNNLEYSSEKKRNKYMVAGEYGAWQIHVHYFGTLETLFQTILYIHLSDEVEKYSILIEDTVKLRRKWDKLSKILKQKLNITALVINEKGKVKELY